MRAVSGSDDSTTPPVTTATTPTDTTPANTTPTDTTPTDTTPTDTTPTDTTPTTTTPTSGGVTSVPTEATLRPGTTGSSVTDLQKALNQLGYDAGTADGNYGAGDDGGGDRVPEGQGPHPGRRRRADHARGDQHRARRRLNDASSSRP